jgi:hypothetical protein
MPNAINYFHYETGFAVTTAMILQFGKQSLRTLPAPTMHSSPKVTLNRITVFAPIQLLFPMQIGCDAPQQEKSSLL